MSWIISPYISRLEKIKAAVLIPFTTLVQIKDGNGGSSQEIECSGGEREIGRAAVLWGFEKCPSG